MGALMAPHKIAIPSVHQGRESMLPVISEQGRPVAKAPHPRLIGSEGIYRGYTFPLAPDITEIGRDIGNTLSLPQDSSISRRHATIRALEGAFLVMDEGSANGIFVNGVRVTQATPLPLNPGDEVEIGSTKFKFVI